ncbi:uncharacterized protein LOC130975400 [Arachis stenosperma]|uniref:uncharacterized protein LOC130975400 n=1 Tax=Arachis stenosperma TaxID=217475 RepID=UPI0025AB7B62|nr:uncharacterized protein LOC130975400 [Arachis stenosperma]
MYRTTASDGGPADLTQAQLCFSRLLPKSKKEVETETLASPPPPQGLPPSVALRHYHRCLVVRASSSFKKRNFFFLDLGASVPGIHLLHRAPAAVRRALSHHRLRLVVADSSNPPPSSELCSSPGLCLRHDSAPSSQTAQKKNPSPFQFPSFEFREQKLNQEKILDFDDSEEKPTYVRFLVSNSAAGSVIGKGGSTITDFQSQSGARIQLSHNHEFFPGTTDRIIMVSGGINEILRAVELILSKLLSELQSEDENDAEPKTKVRLIVPNVSCGGIIGKGGATIRSFIEESQAGIKISSEDNNYYGLNDRLVTLTGTLDDNKCFNT